MHCARVLRIASTTIITAVLPLAYVHAETVNCTAIAKLPYIISAQGAYCFTGHFITGITKGNAITIDADNVMLDLNGFKLQGMSAGVGTVPMLSPGLRTLAIGIYAKQRQNITIKNGAVREFYYGILLDDIPPYTTSREHVIEDIVADQNTYVGMQINGYGNIIRNNQVMATGGTTVNGANTNATGIVVSGSGAQVLNNMVTDVVQSGAGNFFGMYLSAVSNSVVGGNRIRNVRSYTGTGRTYGMYLASGSNIIVRDNSISDAQYGIYFNQFAPAATGKYMNNMTQGVTTAYYGGTAAGTTNY